LVGYHFDFMHLDRAYATTVTRATTIDATKLRRVLLIMPYWLGDAVMVSPLFTALKRHIPEVEIDALIADNLAELVDHNPAISRVHHIGRAWRRSGVWKTLAPRLQLLRELRRRRYDVVIQPSRRIVGRSACLDAAYPLRRGRQRERTPAAGEAIFLATCL
jgi:ADP-heptose:LPS heptosyltransferase